MAHRDFFQHRNLVANLVIHVRLKPMGRWRIRRTYHVFSSSHQPLVDDFGRIIATGVNMYTFLDGRVGACSQRLSNLVPTRLDGRRLLLARHVGRGCVPGGRLSQPVLYDLRFQSRSVQQATTILAPTVARGQRRILNRSSRRALIAGVGIDRPSLWRGGPQV